MKKATATFFILTILAIFTAGFIYGSPVLAAGQDKGKNSSTPPGWQQGEKAGWEGDAPPGLTEEQLEKKKKAVKKSGKHKGKVKMQTEKAKQETELNKEKDDFETGPEKEKSAE